VTPFDRIVVIFNPKSTGEAPQLAEDLRADLARRLPTTPVSLSPPSTRGTRENWQRRRRGPIAR
jgi:hypothetical protein